MKRIIAFLFITIALTSAGQAQDVKVGDAKIIESKVAESTNRQFMQVTTVESVVAGGLGRSRMIITAADGTQTESEMENLFSMAGLNFKNIKENENKIVRTLKSYTDNGWHVDQVTALTLSPSENGGNGIFMTRYLLSKAELKKGF